MKRIKLSEPSDYIIPAVIAVFNILLLLFPRDVLEAARQGLGLWFNNVLPALTPFIIGTNILIALGVVSAIGRLLDGAVQPLLRLPGSAGFAVAVGMMAGYPMGARTAASLAQSNDISPSQASRLAGFCNNSGPIFVVGAVGTGMFGNANLGFFVLACHYISAVVVGVIGARFSPKIAKQPRRPVPRRRRQPLGQVMGESVQSAMETLITIGGFIILFCVIARMMDVLGLFDLLEWLFSPLLYAVPSLPLRGLAVGIIEITNGSAAIAETTLSSWSIAALAFVVSFGGFSIHAQAISFLSKASAPATPYLIGKLSHAIVTATLAFGFHSIVI